MGGLRSWTTSLTVLNVLNVGDEWHRSKQTPYVTRSRTKSGLGTPYHHSASTPIVLICVAWEKSSVFVSWFVEYSTQLMRLVWLHADGGCSDSVTCSPSPASSIESRRLLYLWTIDYQYHNERRDVA